MAVTKAAKATKAPVKKVTKAPKSTATTKTASKTVAKAPAKKAATKAVASKSLTSSKVKTNMKTATKATAPAKTSKTTKPVKAAPVKAAKAPAKTTAKAVTPAKPVKAVKEKAPAKVVASKVAATPVAAPVKAETKAVAAPLPVRQSAMAAAPQRSNSPFAAARAAQQPQRQIVTTAPMPPQNDNGAAALFKVGDSVVYPAHGVGVVENIETQTIAGMDVQLYAIRFEKDRMCLKIPVFKAKSSGLRKLCSTDRLKDAMKTLQGRAKIKRTMWSRRAQEYEMKINSGDPVSIAEVLRDLKRSNDDHEQSYSERQIYQSALERLAREVAAVQKITEVQAAEQLEKMLGRIAA
ncbi:MAG: CarD family transcriptional regulator [Micavibrio sp.]